MLFAIMYKWRPNTSPEDSRRLRSLFIAWNPPHGMEIVSHYHFARGGGVVIVDVPTPALIYEGIAPFVHILDFELEPVLNVIEAIAISMDVDDWANSVKAAEQLGGGARDE